MIFLSKWKKFLTLFAIGAAVYSAIEILWRGFTHWSMAIVGGLGLCGIYYVNEKVSTQSTPRRCFFCSMLITALEFVAGVIINIMCNMGVWDYSRLRFNLLGQICLLYSFFWFLLSFPAIRICDYIKNNIFSKS